MSSRGQGGMTQIEVVIVMTFLVQECYGSPKKHENLLKFVKIRAKECFDKVLNEEFFKKLMCKMKNIITREVVKLG
jgi:hypothetical protein